MIREQKAKRFEPHLPFADVLMPVDPRAELALAVVEVDRFEEADADRLVELLPSCLEFFRSAEGIAGGKGVAK